MVVEGNLHVGSHPIDLDITPDERHLVVGLNGESNLKVIDLGYVRDREDGSVLAETIYPTSPVEPTQLSTYPRWTNRC